MGQAARTATLVGTVTDPAGALVPGAKVTVTNVETGFVSNGVTNAEGAYYIPFLAVGNYELRIEAAGFKTYVQKGIELRAAEVPRIDVKLEVGATSESVQVTGSAPLLETETSQVSQTVEASDHPAASGPADEGPPHSLLRRRACRSEAPTPAWWARLPARRVSLWTASAARRRSATRSATPTPACSRPWTRWPKPRSTPPARPPKSATPPAASWP